MCVHHEKFPAFEFVVTFSGDGTAVGFAVEPAPPAGQSLAEVIDLITTRRPLHPLVPATGEPVTARLLRRLPLGEIQDFARSVLAEAPTQVSGKWAAAFEEVSRPGRRGRDERAYADVAAMYVSIGHSVPKLAAQLGYSPSRVRNILYEARRRDLLTEAPPGRAGGQLTDKAKEILDGRDG